jgi:hypothetical protein
VTTIAVFGGGKAALDPDEYHSAREIGRRLGRAGYTVMTGGYGGVMEAVSQGGRDANAPVIGVTTAQFDPAGRAVNPYVTQEIKLPTARERLMYLVKTPDAYVVLPGGIGTLAEVANVWELIRVGDMQPKPVICYGEFWRRVAFDFLMSKYVGMDQWTSTRFVETPEQVIDILAAGFAPSTEDDDGREATHGYQPPIGDAS